MYHKGVVTTMRTPYYLLAILLFLSGLIAMFLGLTEQAIGCSIVCFLIVCCIVADEWQEEQDEIDKLRRKLMK